ncbi:CapA family protein [Cellvibrio japonicus]|nr:CapA family protein [Cellvibrio japonicus]QEI15355.1 CapA family protein [Cellvibrio japonicus]QEI18934.1 CapA family protein [Cellvibrio japonicus]
MISSLYRPQGSSMKLPSIYFLCLCTLLAACSQPGDRPVTPGTTPTAAPEHWGKLEARATFAAVGDILMHGDVKKSAAEAARQGWGNGGHDALWAGVKDEISSVDWAFANLETPIAPVNNLGSKAFMFNADPAVLQSLADTGFDMVSFANNHVYDQGRAGFLETLGELGKSPLDFIGAGNSCAEARQAKIRDLGGIKVAFIGASQVFNSLFNKGVNEPCVFVYERKAALEAIAAARAAGAEAVIFSLHWGVEYETAPQQTMIDEAHVLMEGGVDVLLGHHPHVLQPVEAYETRDGRIAAVIYSLGNFISNQSRFYRTGLSQDAVGDPRDGAILRFDLLRKDYGKGVKRVEIANLSAQPLWTENNWAERQRGHSKETIIRVIPNDTRIAQLREQLKSVTDPAQELRLRKQLETYQLRHKRATSILGDGWVYKP